MSDKVQFQTNIPIEIALKYGDGKEVSGQYGDQVMYTLTDDRVMYVPPIVKRRIEELGIGRGESFTLTKAEKKNGTRRTIEWLVAAGGAEESDTQASTQELNGRQRRNGAASEAVCRQRTCSKAERVQRCQGFSGNRAGAIPAASSRRRSGCGSHYRTLCVSVRHGLAVHERGRPRDRAEHFCNRNRVGARSCPMAEPDVFTSIVNPSSIGLRGIAPLPRGKRRSCSYLRQRC